MSVDSTKKAIDRYMKKDMKKATPRKARKKRAAPEKEVEKAVKEWLEKQGFFFTIVESKLSTSVKNYGQRAVPAGFPDIVGVSPQGKAVYIELKSPQSKNNVSFGQYQFLKTAANKGAFAVHTHSVDDLIFKYQTYLLGQDLIQFLPKKLKEEEEKPLFSDL